VFPGQLRPTFESYDRAKRALMLLLAIGFGIGALATLTQPALAIFVVAFVAELVVVQGAYARRANAVRKVAANLELQFPTDRFLVANARIVEPEDRGAGSVRFTTVVLQIGKATLSLWNPGVGSGPFLAIPRADSTIQVIEGSPPRWRVASSGDSRETYLALFADSGLGYERYEQLVELARGYGTR
jgi:hypothetical protein